MRKPFVIISMLLVSIVALAVNKAFDLPLEPPLSPPNSTILLNDAILVPDDIRKLEAEIALNNMVSGYEPAWDRTSDFMLGTVTVAIVLPECDGSSDPCSEQWNDVSGEVEHIRNEVVNALSWWEEKAGESSAQVEFIIPSGHPIRVPTQYEPIELPAFGGGHGLWVDEVMANLGYDNYSGGDTYLLEAREYDNDLRTLYGTDWAFTIFVADASNDGDGLFADFVPAWAYIAGPFLGMNTVNNGFGYQFLDGVAAHEIGHVFGSPDEYAGGHGCTEPPSSPSCTTQFGYLGFENQNCGAIDNAWSCNVDVDLSIMRPPEDFGAGDILNVIQEYTVGHIGWLDSDEDSLPDLIDTIPDLVLNAPITGQLYTGQAMDVPFPSALPNPDDWQPGYPDETINDIVAVEYRVDGSGWGRAQATDGAFDSAMEDYYFDPLFCETGTYVIEVRTINSAGNISVITSDVLIVSIPDTCIYTFLSTILRTGALSVPVQTPLPIGYPSPHPVTNTNEQAYP